MSPKLQAIIAHVGFIGWIITLVIYNFDKAGKSPFTAFYIRQTLGIYAFVLVGAWIPVINMFVGVAGLILWILSLIGAIQGEIKESPYLGVYFQDWFRTVV